MKKFAAIESLRGWMAWWVVLGHAAELTGLGQLIHPWVNKILNESFLAVQIFMIVSGFVITHLLIVKRETYFIYIWHRWFRLMPLLIAMIFIMVLFRDLYKLAWIDNPFIGGDQLRIARMDEEKNHWLLHGILHFTLFHGAISENSVQFAASTFLAPAWSLSLEWQFYLIAPLMISGLYSSWRTKFTWAIIALSLPSLLGFFGLWSNFYSMVLLNLPFFLAGIASRQALDKTIPFATILATLASSVIYVAARGLNHVPLLAAVCFVWSIFLFFTASEVGIIRIRNRWLDFMGWIFAYNPLIVELGRVSYSTYLCHVPVLSLVVGGGILIYERVDQSFILTMGVVSILITFPLSILLYRWVERPGIKLGKHTLARIIHSGVAGVA